MKVFKLLLATFTFLLFVQCGSNSNSASDSNSKSDFESGNVMKFKIEDVEVPSNFSETDKQQILNEKLGTLSTIEMFDNYIRVTFNGTRIYNKVEEDTYMSTTEFEEAFFISLNSESGHITGYDLVLCKIVEGQNVPVGVYYSKRIE